VAVGWTQSFQPDLILRSTLGLLNTSMTFRADYPFVVEETIFSSKWYGLLGLSEESLRKTYQAFDARDLFKWFIALAIALHRMTMQKGIFSFSSSSFHWKIRTRTILLHYYQIIGISIYSLLMTRGKESKELCCWVGHQKYWGPERDPLSVFSPPCSGTGPRGRSEENWKLKTEKAQHNFEISQLDPKRWEEGKNDVKSQRRLFVLCWGRAQRTRQEDGRWRWREMQTIFMLETAMQITCAKKLNWEHIGVYDEGKLATFMMFNVKNNCFQQPEEADQRD
jgi:hypothetical protein